MPKLEDLELKVKQVTANTQGLKGLTSALKGLADSARQLNNSHSDISKLANAFKEFDPKTAAAIKSFSTAIKGLKDTALASSTISIAIGQIAKAFQELTEGVDVEKLERIAYAMNNIKSVSGSAKLLAAAKGAVKTAMEANAPGTKSFGDTMETVSDTTKDAGAAQIEATGEAAAVSSEKLERMWQILEQMGTSVKEDSQLLEEMNRVLNEATPEEVAAAYERMYDALASGNASEISAALSNLQGILSNMAYEAESAAVETEKLGVSLAGLKSVGSALWKVGSGFATVTKTIASPIWDRFKAKLNGIVGGIRNLVNSFGRIAMYRALRTAIKAITTGFSEGIKHVYQWSQLVGDSFVKSMDSMATSAHYLRDSLGAMASPLIDALAPAIEVLVEHFVTLLNVVNQFIAALTGKDTWRKAVRTPTTYSGAMKEAADNTKKATKAQKELNKALQGFDELNLLTTSEINARKPTTPSSGKTPGVSSTEFETKPIAKWIKEIKNAIKKGDWNGAGKLLATKLNGMLDKWKAKEFGEKIGQKFQNGIDFYLGFMKNFDWAKLGIKAGDFINGVLSKIKPKALGEAMVAKLKAALKFLANFSWTINLKPLGEAFGHAFNELFSADTMNDLGHTISGLINDAIDLGIGFVMTADFGTAAENVMDSLFTAISEINWKDAAKVVAKLATGLLDAIKSALEYAVTHIDVVLQAVWDFVGTLLGELWEYLVGSIGGLLKEFWQYVKENFWESGKDDGNGRKDGPVNSSTTGLGAGTEPTTSSYTEKVKVLYESNAKKIKDEITMFNKMNAKPKITMTTKNFTATEDSIKKITKGKTVMIYAKKDKDSFNAVTKALNKITIDRTATIKFKPVIEVSDKSTGGLSKTIASEAQLKKLLDLRAEGGFPPQGSMFVAGEVPGQAEMVGTINGKTGVASGKEITGIADAVRDTGQTEAELLREQNNLLRRLLTKTGTVTLAPSAAAGRWVSQSQAAYARATGG